MKAGLTKEAQEGDKKHSKDSRGFFSADKKVIVRFELLLTKLDDRLGILSNASCNEDVNGEMIAATCRVAHGGSLVASQLCNYVFVARAKLRLGSLVRPLTPRRRHLSLSLRPTAAS